MDCASSERVASDEVAISEMSLLVSSVCTTAIEGVADMVGAVVASDGDRTTRCGNPGRGEDENSEEETVLSELDVADAEYRCVVLLCVVLGDVKSVVLGCCS